MVDGVSETPFGLTSEQVDFLEGVTNFDIGFPNDFIGPDPHVTGKFTGLAAANAPLQVELDSKPVGLA